MAKDIVGRLRDIARCIYIAVEKPVADDIAMTTKEAADIIESLSPPDGERLTRYDLWIDTLAGEIKGDVKPEGEWVRHEDAAAALAAARRPPDGLAKALTEALTKVENDRTLWTPEWQAWLLDARAALSGAELALYAEAARDTLKAALAPFAAAADQYDRGFGSAPWPDETHASGASLRVSHLRAARAALSVRTPKEPRP